MLLTLKTLFHRDLTRLHQEISAYRDEAKIWYVAEGITNPAGNLCLHLVGNLNAFICAELGKTGYVRDRVGEFSRRDVSKQELLQMVEATRTGAAATLDKLTEEQLQEEYPLRVFSEEMTTEFFLVHLATHFTYHLGQINYHRRMLDGGNEA